MSIDSIIFDDNDTIKETLIKTVLLNAGSHRLKIELNKLKISYTKVCKGAKTSYILRGQQIGKLVVVL